MAVTRQTVAFEEVGRPQPTVVVFGQFAVADVSPPAIYFFVPFTSCPPW